MSAQTQVAEFHQAFSMPNLVKFLEPQLTDRAAMRLDLIQEEASELAEAIHANDIVEVADALADLVYVAYGAALEFGIDLDAVIAEVHRSNMAKLGPNGQVIYREDGKVLKPEGWTPPNIRSVLERGAYETLAYFADRSQEDE